MPRSFIEKIFGLLGKIFFPSQQDWAQRRNAKIMTGAVAAGVVLGICVVWLIKHMNNISK